MIKRWWRNSHITDGVSISKETVFVNDIDYMAKPMAAGNLNHLIRVVFDENFRGLVIDKVYK